MSINLIICQSEITYPERSQNAQLQKYKPECCKISINMSKVYIVCIYFLFVIELHVVFQRMRQIYCIWWTSVIWPWSLRSITYNMIVKVAWYSAYSPEILLIKFICIVLYCVVLYCIVLYCIVLTLSLLDQPNRPHIILLCLKPLGEKGLLLGLSTYLSFLTLSLGPFIILCCPMPDDFTPQGRASRWEKVITGPICPSRLLLDWPLYYFTLRHQTI